MSYKRREPVSEREMLKVRYKHHHTICATLRNIYVNTDDENIKLKLRLAMAMAKAMQNKLKEYRAEKIAWEKKVSI
jgi:hypothetical protein